MPEIVIQSFKEFLTIKIIANKHKFHHLMKMHKNQGNEELIINEILVVFEGNQIFGMNRAINQLKDNGIIVEQSTRLFQQQKLENFDSFTEKVFGSQYSYSLLIVDSFLSKRIVKLIPQYLFNHEEKFSIKKLDKNIYDQSDIIWFLIKEKVSRNSDSPTQSKYFSCDSLIKLELSFIINVRQFLNIFFRDEHQITIFQQKSSQRLKILSEKLSKYKPDELYIYISKSITFYIKISADQIQALLRKLEQLYKQGFRICIEWNDKEACYHKTTSLNYQNLQLLQQGLQQRMQRFLTDFNIKSENKRFHRQFPLNETKPLDQELHQSQEYIIKVYTPAVKQFLSGKDRDILSLEDKWFEISQFLKQRIWNRTMIENNNIQQLKIIAIILDYRLNKFRVQKSRLQLEFKKQIYYQEDPIQSELIQCEYTALNSYFFLYEYFFPDMLKIIQNLCNIFNIKTIRQIIRERFRAYLKDSHKQLELKNKDGQPQRFSNNLSVQEQKDKNIKEYLKIMAQVSDDVRNKQLKECKYQQNVLDKILIDYFSEIQSINQGKGYFYVKVEGFQKKQLKQFIGEIIGYQQNFFYWQDVFNMTTLNARISQLDRQKIQKNIDLALYTNTSCLGCAQFFVLNKSIINKHNEIPLRVFAQGSANSRISKEFMEQVCSMLNKNGGIILFNCIKNYGSILPKGSYLTKIDRKNYTEQIKQLLKQFYPIVKLNQQIIISFVPIQIKNEKKDRITIKMFQQPQKKNQFYEQNSRIDGFYIMRIKVCSKDKSIIYYWGQQAKKQMQNSKNIKNKQSKIEKNQNQYNDFRPQTYTNPLNHRCKQIIINESQDQSNSNRQKSNKTLQKTYNHMSMIVAKSQNLHKIKDILVKQRFNVQIQSVFKDYQFGIAKYTAALFHNDPFNQILKFFINSKDLQFDGKRVLSIFITEYLKIDCEEGLKESDLENAGIWLNKEFPKQKLRYYTTKSNVPNLVNYYIKTESKMSTLFMYYVFNHYKIKTIFKNPPTNQIGTLKQYKIKLKESIIQKNKSRRP